MSDLYDVLGVDPSATADDIRAAYIDQIRTAHPDVDGGDEDWAKELTAAYNVLSDSVQRSSYDQSRRAASCPFCGVDLDLEPDADLHLYAHFARDAATSCQICGRRPTGAFRFRSNSGFILARQVSGFDGLLCAPCSRGMYREFQARNITRGPWGFISFFAAIWYLMANANSYYSTDVSAPQPADPLIDASLRGRPVFARGTVWISLIVIGFLFSSLFGSNVGNSQTAGFSNQTTSQSSTPGWVVNSCVDFQGEMMVEPVSCGTSRSDGWIVNIVSNDGACPVRTDWYVDVSPGRVACIDEY